MPAAGASRLDFLLPRRLAPARRHDERQLHEARDCGHAADARHGTAQVRALEKPLKRGTRLRIRVVLPEGGPRRDDEDETRFEEIGGEQKPAEDADDYPPVCTRASRSTRAATSR